jgi:putative hydrolase of the HAD superfamily
VSRGSLPDAVFFDVGNTLLLPYPSVPAVVAEVLERKGHVHDIAAIDALMPLVDEFYEDRYRADDTFWTSEEETSQVWVGMYALLCRRLGIDESRAEELARDVYDQFGRVDRWRAYDDVAPCFERLREAGVKTGVISNWDTRLSGLLDGLGLSPLLDTVVASAEIGLHKPDPRVFEYACARLQVEPERAAHVGDHYYSDYIGATAIGMQGVLIDRHGLEATGLSAPFITSLDELEGVLRR